MLLFSYALQAQGEIGVWEIKNSKIVSTGHSDDRLASDYWGEIFRILPNDLLRKHVTSLRLFTDGKANDMAGMNQLDETNANWQIDIDVTDMDIYSEDKNHIVDYSHTLIHEFGHLLSLNKTQISPTNDELEDSDKGYLTAEGYALKGSYLSEFVAAFWVDKLYEWDKIDAIRNENRKQRKLSQFYVNNKTDFLTDYAAEAPEEDLAESWTFFVLSDKQKLTDEIKLQKVNFFYQFEELVELRNEIRGTIKVIPDNYVTSFFQYIK